MTDFVRAFLVESDPAVAAAVRDALSDGAIRSAADPRCEFHVAEALGPGLTHFEQTQVGLLMLGLPIRNVPHPADVIARVRRHGGDVPIVVLVAATDEAIGAQAMQAGAHDYLVKEELDRKTIRRSLRYARETHRLGTALLKLSLSDELTGLLNRRGFFVHADRAMKLASRTKGLWLVLVGVDGLRQINERHGQRSGDLALETTARLLRETCRDSDIVARVGGDEFGVLLVDSTREGVEVIFERLRDKLVEWNAASGAGFELALSIGAARREPKSAYTLDQLLTRADDQLLSRKKQAASA